MKNITFYCVHCGKLLEFKQEYANQAATCPFCNESITVPEFNSVEVEAEAAPENSVKQRFSSAYCIGGWTEIAIPFLKFMSVLTGIATISTVIMMIVTKSANLYWSPILIVVGLLAFYVFYIVDPLDNPNKKIINSPIKKTALILWIILCMALAVILIIGYVFGNVTFLNGIRSLLLILIIPPATAISPMLAFRLYKIRTKEDADFTKEEIADDERKKNKYRSSAIYYTFASFILPLFGLFTLGAFIDIYKAQKEEQQENMGKIIFITILSGIYNIPSITMLLSCFGSLS